MKKKIISLQNPYTIFILHEESHIYFCIECNTIIAYIFTIIKNYNAYNYLCLQLIML